MLESSPTARASSFPGSYVLSPLAHPIGLAAFLEFVLVASGSKRRRGNVQSPMLAIIRSARGRVSTPTSAKRPSYDVFVCNFLC